MTQIVNKPPAVLDASTRLAAERTRLAHERTLLAWTRTALSLITFGFGLHQVIQVLRGSSAPSKVLLGPREFGLIMIFVGLLSLALAVWQNRKEMRLLQAQYPDLSGSPARILAALISVLGVLAFLAMLSRE